MEMETLAAEKAAAFLDSATYIEPMIDAGEKAVHFGIDALGREFILIASQLGEVAKLGFL